MCFASFYRNQSAATLTYFIHGKAKAKEEEEEQRANGRVNEEEE